MTISGYDGTTGGFADEPTEAQIPDAPAEVVEAVEDVAIPVTEEVAVELPLAVVEIAELPRKSLKQRLLDLFPKSKPRNDAFTVFKGLDDKWYWHAVFTNNFQDLEGEILTEKAHDKYIARLDMGLVPMPVLQGWHTPGSEHGQADSVWRDGHLVHAVGHFDDTPQAQKAIKFYQKNVGKIKMSHGFTSPEWAFDGKHYDDYNTIEITTLPPYAAANPYTSFEGMLQMAKERSEEKSRYLEALLGKDKLAEIDAASEVTGKALEDLKLAHKDFADVKPATPVTPDTEKALGAVYGELVTGMSEMVSVMSLQAKAIAAKDTQIVALKTEKDTQISQLQKDIADLRTIVNAPPRLASQDSSTVNKDETLKDKLPKENPLAQFLGVPLKVEN